MEKFDQPVHRIALNDFQKLPNSKTSHEDEIEETHEWPFMQHWCNSSFRI